MESHAWNLIETPLGRGKIYCIDTDGSHDGPMVSTERTVVQRLVDAHNADVAQLSARATDWETLAREALHALQVTATKDPDRVCELSRIYRTLKQGEGTNG
jgi:hypothetical protein